MFKTLNLTTLNFSFFGCPLCPPFCVNNVVIDGDGIKGGIFPVDAATCGNFLPNGDELNNDKDDDEDDEDDDDEEEEVRDGFGGTVREERERC